MAHGPWIGLAGSMFTLYAPVSGTVAALPDEPGLALELGDGQAVITAPTRGTLDRLDAVGFELTDLHDRRVGVRLVGDAACLVPLLSAGDALAFDQPVLRWEPVDGASLRVEVVSLGNTDLMPHAQPGDSLVAGADFFSVGPFSCGA